MSLKEKIKELKSNYSVSELNSACKELKDNSILTSTTESRKNFKERESLRLYSECWDDPDGIEIMERDMDEIRWERKMEKLVAHYGNMEFLDGNGYDFCDESDLKTGTVSPGGRGSWKCELGNCASKIGAIRIMAFDSLNEKVHYIILPKAVKHKFHTSAKNKSIKLTVNIYNETYGNSFESKGGLVFDDIVSFSQWTEKK